LKRALRSNAFHLVRHHVLDLHGSTSCAKPAGPRLYSRGDVGERRRFRVLDIFYAFYSNLVNKSSILTQTPRRGPLLPLRSEAEDAARTAEEVRAGLSARPLPSLPSRLFYDDRGGELFDRITRLPEYYLTRTEEGLLPAVAREAVERVRPRHLVELGSGLG